MVYQSRFLDCSKWPTLVGNVDGGRGCGRVRQEVYGNSLYLPLTVNLNNNNNENNVNCQSWNQRPNSQYVFKGQYVDKGGKSSFSGGVLLKSHSNGEVWTSRRGAKEDSW